MKSNHRKVIQTSALYQHFSWEYIFFFPIFLSTLIGPRWEIIDFMHPRTTGTSVLSWMNEWKQEIEPTLIKVKQNTNKAFSHVATFQDDTNTTIFLYLPFLIVAEAQCCSLSLSFPKHALTICADKYTHTHLNSPKLQCSFFSSSPFLKREIKNGGEGEREREKKKKRKMRENWTIILSLGFDRSNKKETIKKAIHSIVPFFPVSAHLRRTGKGTKRYKNESTQVSVLASDFLPSDCLSSPWSDLLVIQTCIQPWSNSNTTRITSGTSKINGAANYSVANRVAAVRSNDSIVPGLALLFLGCYSCFCCCCMGCSLAKHLGETTIIGCCPFSTCYLRTKLRTARRIEVSTLTSTVSLIWKRCARVHAAVIAVRRIVVYLAHARKWPMNLSHKAYGRWKTTERRIQNLIVSIRAQATATTDQANS